MPLSTILHRFLGLHFLIKLILTLFLAVICFILFWISYDLFWGALGYYTNADIETVIDVSVKTHNPQECTKYSPLFDLGPQKGEQVRYCIYKSAQLLKDPNICELLMPSDYGLDCIGTIWGGLIDKSNCHWYEKDSIRCFEEETLTPHITVCDPITQSKKFPDECIHRIASHDKDATKCDGIKNEELKSICKVRIETWQKYPQLRDTIYFSQD